MLCGNFTFSSSQDSDYKGEAYPFKMDDRAEVIAGDNVILTGFIDDILPAYDKGGHSIEVAGRDITEDLVDCSRAGDSNSWNNLSVRDIAAKLCAPHSISITVDDSANALASQREAWFSYNEGEKIVETLKRLCSNRGIQLLTNSIGRLLLTKLGSSRATDVLETGINIEAGRLTSSNKERYSDYFTKGIGFAIPGKTVKDYVQPKGEAQDPVIQRYRPLVSISDTASSFGGNNDTAKWEASLRAGKSRMYEYQVFGWLQSDGTPWDINMLVQVRDKVLGIDDEFLIYAIQYSVSPDEGTASILYLCSPEKYKAEAALNKVVSPFDAILAAAAGGGNS